MLARFPGNRQKALEFTPLGPFSGDVNFNALFFRPALNDSVVGKQRYRHPEVEARELFFAGYFIHNRQNKGIREV